VRKILVRKILVLMCMTCSVSEQPDVLGPCILARVVMVDVVDLRSRAMLRDGGERLADRHDRQRDASKNRAAFMARRWGAAGLVFSASAGGLFRATLPAFCSKRC